jgi:hypothetical protein
MSKERELLERVMNLIDYRYAPSEAVAVHREIKELLAQPEQEEEPVAWMQDDIELYVQEEKDIVRGYVIPLYTAPPKREPFGPEERQRLSKAYSTKAEQVAFEDGVIFAEISHGITGVKGDE